MITSMNKIRISRFCEKININMKNGSGGMKSPQRFDKKTDAPSNANFREIAKGVLLVDIRCCNGVQ